MEAKFLSTQGNTFTLTITGYRDGEIAFFAGDPCELVIKPIAGILGYYPQYFVRELKMKLVAISADYFDGLITTTANGFPVTLKRNATTVFTGRTNGYNTEIEVRGGQFVIDLVAYDAINERANAMPFVDSFGSATVGRIASEQQFQESDTFMPQWENQFYSSSGLRIDVGLFLYGKYLQKEIWERLNETFLVTFFNTGEDNVRGFVHDYSSYSGITRELQAVNEYAKRRYFPAARKITVEYEPSPDPYLIVDFEKNIEVSDIGVSNTVTSYRSRLGTDWNFVLNFGTVRNIDTLTATPVGFYEPITVQQGRWRIKAISNSGIRYWRESDATWQTGSATFNFFDSGTTNNFQNTISDIIADPGLTWAAVDDIIEYEISLFFFDFSFIEILLEDSTAATVGTRTTLFDGLRMTMEYDFNPGELQNKGGIQQAVRYLLSKYGFGGAVARLRKIVPSIASNSVLSSGFTTQVNENDYFAEDIDFKARFETYKPYVFFDYQFVNNLDGISSQIQPGTVLTRKVVEFIAVQFAAPVMEISGEFIADETLYTNPLTPFLLEYAVGSSVLCNAVDIVISCKDEIAKGRFVERKQG
jgi:hypothetical protein